MPGGPAGARSCAAVSVVLAAIWCLTGCSPDTTARLGLALGDDDQLVAYLTYCDEPMVTLSLVTDDPVKQTTHELVRWTRTDSGDGNDTERVDLPAPQQPWELDPTTPLLPLSETTVYGVGGATVDEDAVTNPVFTSVEQLRALAPGEVRTTTVDGRDVTLTHDQFVDTACS